MYYSYKSYQIDYTYIFKRKKTTILFLHGWGGNSFSFNFLNKYLINNYNILQISMPPYFLSNSKYQSSILPLTIYDYKILVENICILHNVKSVNIICHSFGFRIALLLTSSALKIKSLIITGGAGINFFKPLISSIKHNQKLVLNKLHHFTQKKKPATDYSILDSIDKQTFKNIIKINLINYIQMIKCPTLLFWGKYDKDTPIKICKYLKKNIPKSKAKIVSSDHFAYLNNRITFTNETLQFFKEHYDSC